MIFKDWSVENAAVSNVAAIPHLRALSGLCVDNAVILNIAVISNSDKAPVSTEPGTRANEAAFPNYNVTDQGCRWMDVASFSYRWIFTIK